MNPPLNPCEKQELIKLIVQAGLEEDFMKWLEEKGYNVIFGRLDNIPDELLVAYVRNMKLLDNGEDEDHIYEDLSEVEPDTKVIPAKKAKR
ncbi:MAG: hypothetical protein DRO40_04505 [Thermoprotei archaeon]|nr:MAG: hypothetical protein DRO40_04505 [Thermoprotei archaeon]